MEYDFWTSLTQKKYNLFFFDGHYKCCLRIEKVLDIILSILSMGSLAAWFITNNHIQIYAGIIVVSNVAMAVRPHLPYQSRILELREMTDRLEYIYIDMERIWFKINSDKLTEEEIEEEYFNYEKKWLDCKGNYFKKDTLSTNNKRINNYAQKMKEDYFKNFLHEED